MTHAIPGNHTHAHLRARARALGLFTRYRHQVQREEEGATTRPSHTTMTARVWAEAPFVSSDEGYAEQEEYSPRRDREPCIYDSILHTRSLLACSFERDVLSSRVSVFYCLLCFLLLLLLLLLYSCGRRRRHQTKHNDAKRSETKRNGTKRNETKRNEANRNEMKRSGTKIRYWPSVVSSRGRCLRPHRKNADGSLRGLRR